MSRRRAEARSTVATTIALRTLATRMSDCHRETSMDLAQPKQRLASCKDARSCSDGECSHGLHSRPFGILPWWKDGPSHVHSLDRCASMHECPSWPALYRFSPTLLDSACVRWLVYLMIGHNQVEPLWLPRSSRFGIIAHVLKMTVCITFVLFTSGLPEASPGLCWEKKGSH